MSASRDFDCWQNTQGSISTDATLLLLLRATGPVCEVEASLLSKQALFVRVGSGLFSFSVKGSIFTSCVKSE